MAITEHTINDALAAVLSETRSLWRVDGVGEIGLGLSRP